MGQKRFRSGELERAFHVLFGKQSRWRWPFFGEDLPTIVANLGCSAIWLGIILGIFVKFELTERNIVILAAVVLIWNLIKLNADFARESSLRRRYRKRYLSHVEHTEAYSLLEEALEHRRKGVIEGLGNKEQTEKVLTRLWKSAFAEAEKLALPTNTMSVVKGDPISEQPIGEQVKQYLDNRTNAYKELADTIQLNESI